MIRFCHRCFAPEAGKVRSKNLVSVVSIAYGDWAIGQKFLRTMPENSFLVGLAIIP